MKSLYILSIGLMVVLVGCGRAPGAVADQATLNQDLAAQLQSRNAQAYRTSLVKVSDLRLTPADEGAYRFEARLGIADVRRPNEWKWFRYAGDYDATSRSVARETLAP